MPAAACLRAPLGFASLRAAALKKSASFAASRERRRLRRPARLRRASLCRQLGLRAVEHAQQLAQELRLAGDRLLRERVDAKQLGV